MAEPENIKTTLRSLKSDDQALIFEWGDGLRARIDWGQLRRHCPCATCRSNAESPQDLLPILQPAETKPLAVTAVKPLGNYAYGIGFSDGHSSGIYSLQLLRAMCEQSTGTSPS